MLLKHDAANPSRWVVKRGYMDIMIQFLLGLPCTLRATVRELFKIYKYNSKSYKL